MTGFTTVIPPHIAEVIRHLPPDVKRSVKQAIRALNTDPRCGEPLRRELEGYWKYRVRRFRIVYSIDQSHRKVRIFAVGHRRSVYEAAAAQLQRPA